MRFMLTVLMQERAEITVPVDGSVKLTKELGLSLVNSTRSSSSGPALPTMRSHRRHHQVCRYRRRLLPEAVCQHQEKAEEPARVYPLKIIDDKERAIARVQVEPVNGKSSVISDILSYRWDGQLEGFLWVRHRQAMKGQQPVPCPPQSMPATPDPSPERPRRQHSRATLS